MDLSMRIRDVVSRDELITLVQTTTEWSNEELAALIDTTVRNFGLTLCGIANACDVAESTVKRWQKCIANPAPRVRAYVAKTLGEMLSQQK